MNCTDQYFYTEINTIPYNAYWNNGDIDIVPGTFLATIVSECKGILSFGTWSQKYYFASWFSFGDQINEKISPVKWNSTYTVLSYTGWPGLSRMEGLWGRGGSGDGHTLSR